jgi:hypothetical protein
MNLSGRLEKIQAMIESLPPEMDAFETALNSVDLGRCTPGELTRLREIADRPGDGLLTADEEAFSWGVIERLRGLQRAKCG